MYKGSMSQKIFEKVKKLLDTWPHLSKRREMTHTKAIRNEKKQKSQQASLTFWELEETVWKTHIKNGKSIKNR